MKRRVVVTGIGTVNPLGNSVKDFWTAIKQGNVGIGPITRFDTSEYTSKIAAEVKGFDPSHFMEKKDARKMGLFSQYAVASAVQAMAQAGLTKDNISPLRSSVIIGNGVGGFEVTEESHKKLFEQGPRRIAPLTIPKIISNEVTGNIAILFNAQGPAYTITTACASGTDAIGNAVTMIRSGRCDISISGGTESSITGLGVGGFCALKALSTAYNDTPEKASRPFDRDRDGFVIGEGAGILVLESLEHAKSRNARILAEIKGYGITCDAYHLTAPEPNGIGAANAMRQALEDANLQPKDIGYINAHGTSTPTNDPIETKAIKKAFGDHAYALKVSSTKSMTGHCIGAAGAIEAIICILALQDNFIPGTINLENPDYECDLDYVPLQGVPLAVDHVMSNSLGFGGHNGILILSRYAD